MTLRRAIAPVLVCGLSACTIQDSEIAAEAQSLMIGMSESEVQTCLGVPERRAEFGTISVLTYVATAGSPGGVSVNLPVVGGVSLNSQASTCRATVRLDEGRVTRLSYSGDADAPLAPNAYCASLVRSCVPKEARRPLIRPANDREVGG